MYYSGVKGNEAADSLTQEAVFSKVPFTRIKEWLYEKPILITETAKSMRQDKLFLTTARLID